MVFREGRLIAHTLKVTIYFQKHDNILISREKKHLIFKEIRRLSKFGLGRIFTPLGIFGLFLQNIYPWYLIKKKLSSRYVARRLWMWQCFEGLPYLLKNTVLL